MLVRPDRREAWFAIVVSSGIASFYTFNFDRIAPAGSDEV